MTRVRTDGRADYRAVLRNREFAAVLLSQSLSVIGDQVARIALALLVYQRTGSALASSATYAVSYGAYLLGGPVLSTLSDRYPRRTVMVISDVLRCGLVAVLALQPSTPVLFVLVALAGTVAPAFASARSATLPDLLGDGDYGTGLGLISSAAQTSQFIGFALGGGLVAALGVSSALLVDAGSFALSALCLLVALRLRASVGGPRTGLLSESLLGASTVWRTPGLRHWLAWGLLLSTGAAAPEGLAVAVGSSLGGGAVAAGLLTAAAPLGYVLGTFVVLRVPSGDRRRVLPVAAGVAFVPLALTPLAPSLALLLVLWVVAGAGGAAQIVANSEYALRCLPEVRGRAFGLAGTALMVWQAVVLVAVGAAAGPWSARTVVGTVGVLGLAATIVLARRHPGWMISRTGAGVPRSGLTEGSTT